MRRVWTPVPESLSPEEKEVIRRADDDATEDERPSWLPSNFGSGESLAKSWSHVNIKITEMGQENVALRQQVSDLLQENELLTAENERLVGSKHDYELRVAALERAYVARMAVQR